MSGIDGLNSFLETRDVYPEAVNLAWKVIVNYPGAETIETQDIELLFICSDEPSENTMGRVVLHIKHTNQSWAVEILSIIKNKIAEVSKKNNKRYTYSKKITESSVSRIGSMFLLIISMFSILSSSLIYNEKDRVDYYSVLEYWDEPYFKDNTTLLLYSLSNFNDSELNSFSEDFVSDKKIKGHLSSVSEDKKKVNAQRIHLVLALLLGPPLLLLSIFFYCYKTVRFYSINSYVLINNRSEIEKKNRESEKNGRTYYSFSLILFSIVCGALGNFLYVFMY